MAQVPTNVPTTRVKREREDESEEKVKVKVEQVVRAGTLPTPNPALNSSFATAIARGNGTVTKILANKGAQLSKDSIHPVFSTKNWNSTAILEGIKTLPPNSGEVLNVTVSLAVRRSGWSFDVQWFLTPLAIAILSRDQQVVGELLDKGADPNFVFRGGIHGDTYKTTAIHEALRKFPEYAIVDYCPGISRTYQVMSDSNLTTMMKILFARKARCDIPDGNNKTALELAVDRDCSGPIIQSMMQGI